MNQREFEDLDTGDDQIIGVALKWSLIVIALVAVIAVPVFAYMVRKPKPVVVQVVSEPPPPKVLDTGKIVIPQVMFVDATEAMGIEFVHQNCGYGKKLLPETMGSGCAVFDYNDDGHQDILFLNCGAAPWDPRPTPPSGVMALYQNQGDGRFQDVTSEVGLDQAFYAMGVTVGDYDADGDRDLFISAVGPNRLYRNDDGRFVEMGEAVGVAGEDYRWSTSATWLDYDNDGKLDLFVCNYLEWSPELDEMVLQLDGQLAFVPPTEFEGVYSYLYHNEGNGRFKDVSESAGIHVTNQASGVPVGKSLGVVACDVDQDGWVDLIVANDTVQNFLFHNNGGKGFEEVGGDVGIAYDVNGHARGAMGIDAGFFRDAQTMGVLIGNFATEMSALYVKQPDFMSFVDSAVATGLGPPTRRELTFGVFFFDYDLDGRLDVLGANGHLEELINKIQPNQFYKQPTQLFWNAGTKQVPEFVLVPEDKSGADLMTPVVGRGAAYGDLDGDGDLDVVITENNGPARVYRNDQQTGHHWLRVDLEGTKSNPDAIGADVQVHLRDRVLRQTVVPTRSYLSQVELPLTFGLGESDAITKLEIRWPSGTLQVIENVAADQLLKVKEDVSSSASSAIQTRTQPAES